MANPLEKPASYEDLLAVPDHLVAEILNGTLHTHPRPRFRHARAATSLGTSLTPPFDWGKDGPGGWWILIEPEIHLTDHIIVPDLAGWRRENVPKLPDVAWTDIPPDWVCEVLSPSTARLDRTIKRDIYATHKVSFIWLVEPENRTVECFELKGKNWQLTGTFADDDTINAPPFAAVPFSLSPLWID